MSVTIIVEFSETEHEFKRMKGIVARFTDPNNPDATFYTVKLIQQGQTLKSALAWEFSDGKFGSFNAEVGFKVPDDNQVLIVGKDIFCVLILENLSECLAMNIKSR